MSTINDTATVNLFVNGEQAEAAMDRLRKKSDELGRQLKEAMAAGNKKEANRLQRDLDKVTRELNRTESAAKGTGIVLNDLANTSIHGLRNALKHLKRQLEMSKPDSEAWHRYAAQIDLVKARLNMLNDELSESENLWSKFKQWSLNAWPALDLLRQWGGSLSDIMRGAVDAYAGMDAEMANVRKFTGMTAEEVADLNDEFKKMDTRTSREALNQLAQEAGRLGKTSKEDVLGFVRAADQINVALDDLGEGATLTLSKLTGIFGDEERYGTEQSLLKVGSVINELSQNCSASAPYLAQFASRMGGVGAQAKMTIPQIMAFGAVLDSNAQAVEASSTALSQVIVRMMQEPAKYAQVAGLDVKKFSDMLKSDVNGALILFLETLQKAGGMDVLSPMFKDMGENGSRAIAALSTLATHIDLVKAQQRAANIAFVEGVSVTKEAAIQNGTVAAGLDKCKKAAHELQVELGERLRPLMSHLLTTGSAVMRALLSAVKFIDEHKASIITITAATTSYVTVLKLHALWLDRVAIKTMLAEKWSRLLAVAQRAFSGIWASMKLGLAGLTNTVQYFTNGLEVNYTMQQRWRTAMAAMNWKAWAGGVTAAAAAVALLYVKLTDVLSVSKMLNEVEKEANKSVAEQMAHIRELQRVMNDQNAAYQDRIKAIKDLEAIIPDYHAYLTREGQIIRENTSAIDKYIDAVRRQARVEAARAKLVELEKERLDIETDMAADKDGVNVERAVQSGISGVSLGPLGGLLHYGGATAANAGVNQVKLSANQRKMEALEGLIGNQMETELSDRKKSHADDVAQMQKINRDLYNSDMEYREAVDALKKRLVDAAEKGVPEAKRNDEYRNQLWFLNQKFYGRRSSSPEATPEGSPAPPLNDTENVPGSPDRSDPFAAEKQWRQEQEAEARIAYAQGEATYSEHTARMAEIAEAYYSKLLEREDLSAEDKLKVQAEYWEAVNKKTVAGNALLLDDENRSYQEVLDHLRKNHLERLQQEGMSAEDRQRENERYADARELAELEHLDNILSIYKEGSDEWLAAQRQLQEKELAAQERHIKEMEDRQKQYADIKKRVFGLSQAEKDEEFNKQFSALTEVYNQELAAAGDNEAEKLRIKKAYMAAELAMRKEYNQAGAEDSKSAYESAIGKSAEWLQGDGGKALTGALSTVTSGMSSIFSGLSSMIQAELDIQTAKIEKRYDREIELAQGNSYKTAKLEKQKQKEIAKMKNEANKKMFAMQVIQAVAQTAQNALGAYGSTVVIPVVGKILAPIAAAAALAAGMIQVATIKKQQQAAEAQGYSRGGFTKPGAVDEPAGIVHAGEWVASQKLLANPVARPMIEALDYAQRTNTIGSLREEDVSRSIRANDSLARIAEDDGSAALVVAAVAQNAQAVNALVGRLNEPFVTVNTVTGDHGYRRAENEYDRLINNKSPKSRRNGSNN